MAVVAFIKQLQMKTEINFSIVLPLSLGAVAGGYAGQEIFSFFERTVENSPIIITQNMIIVLFLAIAAIFIINKDRIQTKNYNGILPCALIGLVIGAIASFVGIGGGPINIVVIMYLFSYDLKRAAVYSIIMIFFSQLSKIVTIAVEGGYAEHDLSVLPWMIAAALAGGFIGAILNRKLPLKFMEHVYIYAQYALIALSLLNVGMILFK